MPSIAECEERIAKFNADCETLRTRLAAIDQEANKKEYDRVSKNLKKKVDKVAEWTEKYNMCLTVTSDLKSTASKMEELENVEGLLDQETVEDFEKLFEEAKKEISSKIPVVDPYEPTIRLPEKEEPIKVADTSVDINFDNLGTVYEPPVKINRFDYIKKIRMIESMLGLPVTDDNLFNKKTDPQIKEIHKELSDKFNKASLGVAEVSVNLYISGVSGSAWFLNAFLAEYYPGIQFEDTQKNLTEFKPQLMEAIMELFQDDPLIFSALKQLSNSYVKLAMYTSIALSKSVKSVDPSEQKKHSWI